MRLNPYIRIMRAAKAGKGVRLTAEEVRFMSLDSAIETVAANTEAGDVCDTGSFCVTKHGIRAKARGAAG
jgi:hypothetical protein